MAEYCSAVRAVQLAGCRLTRLGIHPHSQVLHDWERFLALLQRIASSPTPVERDAAAA